MNDKKTKLIFLAILFFGVFGLVKSSLAATYYVKNGGNDSLDGLSDATAWATIAKVQATVTSGDTVYFRSQDTWTGANPLLYAVAGVTYDGSTYGTGTRATLRATSRVDSNGMVQIAKSNVTFQGFKVDANSLSMSGVAIGYTSPMPTGGISNITVHNCEITNGITTDNPNPSYYYALHVSMGGYSGGIASNITITDNWVHHTGHEGIAIYPQTSTASRINNVLVRNNIIHNTGLTGVRGSPLSITNDSDNVTLEFNSIYDCPSGIGIASYGLVCYGAPSPNGVVVRYNILNNTSGNGINIQGYFCKEGIDGDGEIYGNIAIYGGLSLDSGNWRNGIWKIYNNIFLTNYSAGKGAYVLDGGLYKTAMNATGVEIKNNIFQGTGLRLVRDQANAFGSTGGIIHSNNLFYRTDSSADVVQTSELSDASAIPSTEVSVTHDSTYTYFTKSGGTDWTTKFAAGQNVKWSGFTNAEFNNRLFTIQTVTADQIKVYNIYLLAAGPTETTTVTGEKWVLTTMSASALQSTWESTAQITNPLFTGGTLPTGFIGIYGTNMLPNTNYFSIISGAALDNGVTLGSPYNGSINGAGLASPITRPQGAAYDIGAYEYQGTVVDTTPPTVPTNLSASAVSSSQINLSWTASTDNIGVTGYRIYRCQGAGCAPSTQIANSTNNSYSDTGLSPSTTYAYTVSAYDAAGNASGQSATASATSNAQTATADLNSDGHVNSVDFGIMMSRWGLTTRPNADINQDGMVNSIDFGILMSQWTG